MADKGQIKRVQINDGSNGSFILGANAEHFVSNHDSEGNFQDLFILGYDNNSDQLHRIALTKDNDQNTLSLISNVIDLTGNVDINVTNSINDSIFTLRGGEFFIQNRNNMVETVSAHMNNDLLFLSDSTTSSSIFMGTSWGRQGVEVMTSGAEGISFWTNGGRQITIPKAGRPYCGNNSLNYLLTNDDSFNADKITSGTLGASRIPNLSAEKITSGTLNIERIPSNMSFSSFFNLQAGNAKVFGDSSVCYISFVEDSKSHNLRFSQTGVALNSNGDLNIATGTDGSLTCTVGGASGVRVNSDRFYIGSINESNICFDLQDGENATSNLSVKGYLRLNGASLILDSSSVRCPRLRNSSSAIPVGIIESSDNALYKISGSSKRWKKDIQKDFFNSDLDPHKLYDLPVAQYLFKEDYLQPNDIRYNKPVVGLIAEDVYDIYPIAADYVKNEDGSVEVNNWSERYIIPPMLSLIKEQHKAIEALKAKVNDQEERLKKLEKELL